MILSGLLAAIRALPEYPGLLEHLSGSGAGKNSLALRLPRSARVPVAAAVTHSLGRPALYVVARSDRATTVAEELVAWAPETRVLTFGEPNPLFYEYVPWGPRTIVSRLAVLGELNAPAPDLPPAIVVVSARALMWRTLPKRDFLANTRTIKVGQALRVEKALEGWVAAGYVPATIVIEPGQFSRRGGIIDIFPATAEQPIRIELFGDEIETLRRFDPATQRSGDRVPSVSIGPAREALPRYWQPEWAVEVDEEEETTAREQADGTEDAGPRNLEFYLARMVAPASLLEYLPEGATVLVDDWRELSDAVEELEEQAIALRGEQVAAGVIDQDFPLPYHPWANLQDELADRHPAPVIMAAPDDENTSVVEMGGRFHPGPRFGGQLKPLLDQLASLEHTGDRSVVVTRQA